MIFYLRISIIYKIQFTKYFNISNFIWLLKEKLLETREQIIFVPFYDWRNWEKLTSLWLLSALPCVEIKPWTSSLMFFLIAHIVIFFPKLAERPQIVYSCSNQNSLVEVSFQQQQQNTWNCKEIFQVKMEWYSRREGGRGPRAMFLHPHWPRRATYSTIGKPLASFIDRNRSLRNQGFGQEAHPISDFMSLDS